MCAAGDGDTGVESGRSTGSHNGQEVPRVLIDAFDFFPCPLAEARQDPAAMAFVMIRARDKESMVTESQLLLTAQNGGRTVFCPEA